MKIAILGTSGSGKSTLAQTLGAAYHAPVLHLDTVHFLPGWVERPLDEENAIVRRGRNTHAHHAAPRNQTAMDYQAATALEALVGYLYLTGQETRLLELFRKSQEVASCPAQP